MRSKAAASAAAFGALVVLAGGGAFALTRDPPPSPTTTTTTATTTSTAVPDSAVADALAAALAQGLEVPLSTEQAACLGDALLATVGRARLEALAGSTDPLASLPENDRTLLLRDVVTCVGPDVASALLAPSTTTSTSPAAFPDAGEE